MGIDSTRIRRFATGLAEGGVDSDELGLLEQVFGGRVGAIATNAAGGDLKTMKRLGMTKKDVDAIEGAKGEEAKIALVIKMMAERGLLEVLSSEGGTEVAGSPAEYAQANARFVATVDRFVTNVRKELKMVEPIEIEEILK